MWLLWALVVLKVGGAQTGQTWSADTATRWPHWNLPANTTNRLFAVLPKCKRCSVSAWGDADNGGAGVPGDVANPAEGEEVVGIASTTFAFAALKANGAVSAWGAPGYGGSNVPGDVTNPAEGEEVVTIASTGYAFAALKANGAVSAWGWSDYGGSGVPIDVTNPAGGEEVVAITSNDYAFAALKANGAVSAWGWSDYGGSGVPVDVTSPAEGEEVMAIASTGSAFAALKVNGAVSAWGNTDNGGGSVPDDVMNPAERAEVVGIASTTYAFAALRANGAVSAWGSTDKGGGGVPVDVTSPAGGEEVVAITSTGAAFAALKANGAVSAWGSTDKGGGGVPVDVASPAEGEEVVAITSTGAAFAALKANGAVSAWGDAANGGGGVPGDVTNPAKGEEVVAIASTGSAFAALKANGAVSAWGDANNGGGGVPGDVTSPAGGEEVVAITSNDNAFAALKANGAASAWGNTDNGGDGVPDDVINSIEGEEVVAIAANNNAFAALVHIRCPAGKFTDQNDDCQLCTAGTYSEMLGATACTPCAAGTYSEALGADNSTTCTPCPLGTFSEALGADNSTTCTPCAAGTYSEALGADNSTTCTPCAAGTYSEALGADNSTTCTSCPRGTYSEKPAATSNKTCASCGAGKYSKTDGANSSQTCLSCADGTYSGSGAERCEGCGAGKYSTSISCEACKAGKYAAVNASKCSLCPVGTYAANRGQENECDDCPAGRYASSEGLPNCEVCKPGTHAGKGSGQCDTCPAGTYSSSTYEECVDCAAGLASAEGSSSPSDCQSTTTSFVAGGILAFITLVVMAIYVCFGRARRVAFLEQQTSTPILVQACTAASATILTRMQQARTTGLIWKLVLLVFTFTALFVVTMLWFVTNTFLLSTSFLSSPDWLERSEAALLEFVEVFPLAWFLVIFPPVIRWINAIDFTFLMVGVRVTCLGAQGPALLLCTAVIVVVTVLVIDSQFHAMLALAFVPMTSLVQMELLSAATPSRCAKLNNMLKFGVLAVASAMMMSCSRYVMQVITTLVKYSSFLPYREFSPACNDDGIDSALATISTIVCYTCMVPVLLIMLRVLMPSLPASIKFNLPEDAIKLAKSGQYRKTKSVLDMFNLLKWAMRGLYWMMLKLVAISSARAVDDLKPTTLTQHVQSVKRDGVKARWEQLRHEELPDFLELLRLLQVQGLDHMGQNLWKVLAACAWKLKLALLVVCGVWTDEVATAMQIDTITHQYYGWTQEPKLLHEDVVGVIASMRSMTWMLLPPLIVLTKLAEVTNNPPIFVFTDKLHMTSPLLFWTWAEAEAVMLEGKMLLEAMHDRAEKAIVRKDSMREQTQSDLNDWESMFHHKLCIALVWVLGARLPRFAVQMILFVLVLAMVINPRMEILVLAACVILLWSLVYTFATLLDVRLMLRLRKEQPAVQEDGREASEVEAAEMELPAKVLACDSNINGGDPAREVDYDNHVAELQDLSITNSDLVELHEKTAT